MTRWPRSTYIFPTSRNAFPGENPRENVACQSRDTPSENFI